jgi:AcrR family transcriptional regulator
MKDSKKRKQIIETAKALFMQYGLKRVTIEEICRKAEVSKATCYKYFKNKTELAIFIRDELVKTGFAAFDDIRALDIPFTEKVNHMTQWHMTFFSQISSDFIREIVSIEDVEDEFKKRFLQNIQDAQQNGEIRPELNLELIYLVGQKLQEITRSGDWKKIFNDYGQYVEQVRTILFFGLLTRSGKDINQRKE